MSMFDPLAIAALAGFGVLLGITGGIAVWLIAKARQPAAGSAQSGSQAVDTGADHSG